MKFIAYNTSGKLEAMHLTYFSRYNYRFINLNLNCGVAHNKNAFTVKHEIGAYKKPVNLHALQSLALFIHDLSSTQRTQS